jgi:hypothetical protein
VPLPLQTPSHSYPDTTTGSTRMAHSYRLHAVCLDGMFNIGTQLAGQRPVFQSPPWSITILPNISMTCRHSQNVTTCNISNSPVLMMTQLS